MVEMMDATLNSIFSFLEAAATCAQKFNDLARRLRASEHVTSATSAIEIANVPGGITVAIYVDSELRNGRGLCLLLEVRCVRAQWSIEGAVLVTDERGQYVLKELPPLRGIADMGALIASLLDACGALASEVNGIDLATATPRPDPDKPS